MGVIEWILSTFARQGKHHVGYVKRFILSITELKMKGKKPPDMN